MSNETAAAVDLLSDAGKIVNDCAEISTPSTEGAYSIVSTERQILENRIAGACETAAAAASSGGSERETRVSRSRAVKPVREMSPIVLDRQEKSKEPPPSKSNPPTSRAIAGNPSVTDTVIPYVGRHRATSVDAKRRSVASTRGLQKQTLIALREQMSMGDALVVDAVDRKLVKSEANLMSQLSFPKSALVSKFSRDAAACSVFVDEGPTIISLVEKKEASKRKMSPSILRGARSSDHLGEGVSNERRATRENLKSVRLSEMQSQPSASTQTSRQSGSKTSRSTAAEPGVEAVFPKMLQFRTPDAVSIFVGSWNSECIQMSMESLLMSSASQERRSPATGGILQGSNNDSQVLVCAYGDNNLDGSITLPKALPGSDGKGPSVPSSAGGGSSGGDSPSYVNKCKSVYYGDVFSEKVLLGRREHLKRELVRTKCMSMESAIQLVQKLESRMDTPPVSEVGEPEKSTSLTQSQAIVGLMCTPSTPVNKSNLSGKTKSGIVKTTRINETPEDMMMVPQPNLASKPSDGIPTEFEDDEDYRALISSDEDDQIRSRRASICTSSSESSKYEYSRLESSDRSDSYVRTDPPQGGGSTSSDGGTTIVTRKRHMSVHVARISGLSRRERPERANAGSDATKKGLNNARRLSSPAGPKHFEDNGGRPISREVPFESGAETVSTNSSVRYSSKNAMIRRGERLGDAERSNPLFNKDPSIAKEAYNSVPVDGPLHPWIVPGYDIYVIGLQESSGYVLYSAVAAYVSKINGTVYEVIPAQNFKISGHGDGAYLSSKYTCLGCIVKSSLLTSGIVEYNDSAAFSFHYLNPSKGAIFLVLNIHNQRVCFVNCHLPPGGPKDRLICRQAIRAKLFEFFGSPDLRLGGSSATTASGCPTAALSLDRIFHHIIWCGDFNFRLKAISGREVVELLTNNYILRAQCHDEAFDTRWCTDLTSDFFEESPVTFPPTYKKIKGRPSPELSNPSWPELEYSIAFRVQWYKGRKIKERVPSWTDRILIRSHKTSKSLLQIIENSYESCLTGPKSSIFLDSDHSPVRCGFVLFAPPVSHKVPPLSCNISPNDTNLGLVLSNKSPLQRLTAMQENPPTETVTQAQRSRRAPSGSKSGTSIR